MKRIAAAVMAALLMLLCSGCRISEEQALSAFTGLKEPPYDYAKAAYTVAVAARCNMTAAFLESVLGKEKTKAMVAEIENGTYTDGLWLETAGFSYNVMKDLLSGNIGAENISYFGDNGKNSFTLSFAGDILFDPDFNPMYHASVKGGVLNCIDGEVVNYLRTSDVFLINNEFTYGERGAPLSGKTWTFQAAPSTVNILKDMGADIVSLANNHVYDYGEIGFTDTMAVLDEAKLPYIGAGMNINDAAQGHYFIINGIKVGIIAASRAEKVSFTPVAGYDKAGVMGTYDSENFLKAVELAKGQCDYLVAYVHWGTENSTRLEAAQKEMAREYIDAGVDAVIGGHTHCLQGMEFYNGKPIVYSVGNFWFNSKNLDSCVITVELDREINSEISILPLKQQNCETRLLTGEDARALFDRVESFEPEGITILDDGTITPSLATETE
ncbi:MAG: CapA family protein [Clostridia bacterium]|nr:CapA family protein [Clostridia bacterium]